MSTLDNMTTSQFIKHVDDVLGQAMRARRVAIVKLTLPMVSRVFSRYEGLRLKPSLEAKLEMALKSIREVYTEDMNYALNT